MKIFDKIKEKFLNWFLGVVGLAILSVLIGIYQNTRKIPTMQTQIDSVFSFAVGINTEVYKINIKWRAREQKEREQYIIDSVKQVIKRK
jgi:hypothetical protein